MACIVLYLLNLIFFLSFRQKPPSSGTQHEVFFTQENYKKHSCQPSFVEFLEKHLSPDKDAQNRLPRHDSTMGSPEAAGYNMNKGTNKTGAEKSRSNSAPACLGRAMEFPFISKISIESQKLFLKVFETLRSGQLDSVDLQEVKAVQVCDCITVTFNLIHRGDYTVAKDISTNYSFEWQIKVLFLRQ